MTAKNKQKKSATKKVATRSSGATAKLPIYKNYKFYTIIGLSLIVLICAFFLISMMAIKNPSKTFNSLSVKAFDMPTTDGFSANAFDYDAKTKTFFVAGEVDSKTQGSPLHLIDSETGALTKSLYLEKVKGEKVVHTGTITGLAIFENYFVYVATGESQIYAYKYSEIKNAKGGEIVSLHGTYSLKTDDDFISAHFLTYHNYVLYIGENVEQYHPIKSHNIDVDGIVYPGLIVCFNLNSNYPVGISPTPVMAYSIPANVTGIDFLNERIYLSTSSKTSPSKVYEFYDDAFISDGRYAVLSPDGEDNVSLYKFTTDCFSKAYTLPMGAQEFITMDARIYLVFSKTDTFFDIFSEYKNCLVAYLPALRENTK